MNKHLLRNGLLFSTLIAIPTTLPTAYANEGSGGSSAQAEVQMMDTNHDGVVSADEHTAGAKQMFAKMDADHDGNVTATEMDAAQHAMMKKSAQDSKHALSSAEKIKVIDTNGDGILSAEEHVEAHHPQHVSEGTRMASRQRPGRRVRNKR